jgi:glutamate dehydrogenase
MITADPQRRVFILAEIREILLREAAPDDRDLLLSFAPVVFAEMPDSIALRLTASALAARIREYFRFVARTMPPAFQLYKGLPGLHVVVRNPDDAEEAACGGADGGAHEATIVETHTPDAPFIFESLKNFFQKEGLRVFSSVHPIFTVQRQWERTVEIGGPAEDGSRELFCQFRIERIEARERLRRIEHQVFSVLKTVFLAVEDFPDMVRTAREIAPRLRGRRGKPGEAEPAKAFLNWLLDDNLVLLGMLKYVPGPDGLPHPDEDSALGAFTDPSLLPVVFPGLMEQEQAHIRPADEDERIIDIDYCVNAQAIHHLEPIDDLVIREWAPDGTLACATLILGRLAKGALASKPQDVPLLKEKLAWLLEHSGAAASNSHVFRETRALFNHFPRRELLYADAPAIKQIIDRMLYMSGDDEIAVTVRQGVGYHAVSIAFSDLRYSHKAEEDLKQALSEEFGPISFKTWADLGALALLVFYFDDSALEHEIDAKAVREITRRTITTWEDQAAVSLEQKFGSLEGRRLFNRYVRTETRSGLYRESTRPQEVAEDVRHFEQLEGQLEISISPDTAESATLKIYSPVSLGLTETLRTLQNLSLTVRDEIGIPLTLPEGRKAFLSRLKVEAPPAVITAMIEGEERLRDALRALQEERATDDPLNGLVLLEGLTWRDVEVLRTVRNHLLQVRPVYNAETINGVMLRNSKVAAALYREFAARFDPAFQGQREAAMQESEKQVRATLRAVGSLFDDEILRAFDNLIRSTLRTNAYQRPERPVFAIKVESGKVEGMVSPRPLFEIYVHSRKLEGIHLRGGKVARGGIRWSDRHDDFRTEILGLMKTQMVKNSIIVPIGSKGGFVLKGELPTRPALDAYLVDRYREFISGLLDLTDNYVKADIVHPPEVVRHDDDDPYLVVAADKGTAHLSDTANQVSAQYGFWLGDAFASGGSNGYDHKKEGITARGAWECVRHHFRNLGIDVQTQPFTMAGIGDMAGDVFGNGALRSRTTKLVAVFNHVHIFIDPNPDPEKSFAERERLFKLPRSTWKDYDASLISQGGGVFDRSAKSIPLSPEARALLGITEEAASGEEVIRHILTADVDLLYNGGIGTYIKSESEEDVEVGDRANDRVRVDAKDVRARVIAEGGNLGLTQRARLEYWTKGGLINTDAIDNSGGVDMSDHEVNLKIFLDVLVREGVLKSRKERNQILREMTDEVSALVLQDNEAQALALTLDGVRSGSSGAGYEEFVNFVGELITTGIVNRADDAVPKRDELLANPAKSRGLPRPLLAVLLGHTKNWARMRVLRTPLVDSEAGRPFLDRYFPQRLRDTFAEHFPKHQLRREIIATATVSYLINHAGLTFISRLMQATKRDIGEVVGAYLDADRESGAAEARADVFAAGLSAQEEYAALLDIELALENATRAQLEGKSADAKKAIEKVKARLGREVPAK